MEETKIYCTNLAKYNNGERFGAWFTLPVSLKEIESKLRLNEDLAEFGEEFAIHDYENPYGLKISEYTSVETLNKWVEALEELDDELLKILPEIISAGYEKLEDILENNGINYSFTGCDSFSDLAEEYIEQQGSIKNIKVLNGVPLSSYIDYESLGNDIRLSGAYIETSRGLIEYAG